MGLPVGLSAQHEHEVFLVDRHTNPGFVLREIPLSPPELEGSAYINDDWQRAEMILRNGKVLNGVQVRYDLLNDLFEVRYEDVRRWLDPELFTEVRIYDDPFYSSKYSTYQPFRNFDPKQSGVARTVHSEEAFSVIHRPFVEVKEPTYVPTHHIGNRNKQVLQKEVFYLVKGKEHIPFKRTKGSLAELTGMSPKELKKLLKAEGIDLQEDADLLRVVRLAL